MPKCTQKCQQIFFSGSGWPTIIFHDEWVMKRKLTCTNYFIILEKKRFSREHTKSPNANVPSHPDAKIVAVGYHSPESQQAFHIYYVKYQNTLTCESLNKRKTK